MKQRVKGRLYDTKHARKLAAVCWDNFPQRGDSWNSVLYRDGEGNYFALEEYSWFKEQMIVPKSRRDAELYYLVYATEIFSEF